MTLACTISATGISAPSYPEILAKLQDQYRGIYGQDVYLEPDSQDGQLLAIFASAINDCNAATIAAYNARSPSTAQGAGLASVVKINGIAKGVPTNSTADLTIVGTPGTTIVNGIVGDAFGNQWALPASVLIPQDGDIVETATCTEAGDVSAAAGTITRIITPTRGWQTVTNVQDATPGAPVESDAALRQRQTISTQLPAQTKLEAIVGAIANLSGVKSVRPYQNDTAATDANGLPRNSICMVVQGGHATDIAETIALKKSEGTGTYGSTSETVIDKYGVPVLIRFQRPDPVRLIAEVQFKVRSGYVSSTGDAMRQAMSDYVAGLAIGTDVDISKLEGAANLNNNRFSKTFNIQTVTLARHGDALVGDDLILAFDELPALAIDDITLTVVT